VAQIASTSPCSNMVNYISGISWVLPAAVVSMNARNEGNSDKERSTSYSCGALCHFNDIMSILVQKHLQGVLGLGLKRGKYRDLIKPKKVIPKSDLTNKIKRKYDGVN
jgi:hypothetical protein